MIRRLWHHRFGHVWNLVASIPVTPGYRIRLRAKEIDLVHNFPVNMAGATTHVDFMGCRCGATDKREHAWPHTA